MKITPSLFHAHIKCPTKCWLRFTGEPATGNSHADWGQSQNDSYRDAAIERLRSEMPQDECAIAPAQESLKTSKWRLGFDVAVATSQNLETRLQAVERVAPEGRGKSARLIPIRFVFTNKLGKDEKLLLGFDAIVLSEILGREVSLGKIIHGDNHATLKVKASALTGEVRKRLDRIATLLSNPAPPDLSLNRHCAECEFQARCRKLAVEKDDLSLLAGMKKDERKEYNSKGIFTVTQLSYTFRPRRRPKKLRDKKEKHHHSLKALAIREKKIYIVGSPELHIEGMPVYLDVEGLPDRDFYYLLAVRIGNGESAVKHSLWADSVEDEGKIWREFLGILETVEKPVLIHYGSYETTFLHRMCARFGGPLGKAAGVARAIEHPVNLLSTIYAQVYFPTFSNGLKEIAGALGFKWSEADASGSRSVIWRHSWNGSRDPAMKEKLITYNAEDCEALGLVERTVSRLADRNVRPDAVETKETGVVRTDDLKHPLVNKWREFSSPLSELEFVTNAAHWDYQRDRIYVRSSKQPKRARRKAKATPKSVWRVDKVIKEYASTKCPRCQRKGSKHKTVRSRIVQEVVFGRFSVKRRIIRYEYQPYWCSKCKATFGVDDRLLRPGKRRKYGTSLLAYFFYHVIELGIPMHVAA